MIRSIALAVCLSGLLGCSQTDPADRPAEASAPAATSAAAPSGDELNQAIQQPIDRAKAVEADLMKAQKAKDEKLREQGG